MIKRQPLVGWRGLYDRCLLCQPIPVACTDKSFDRTTRDSSKPGKGANRLRILRTREVGKLYLAGVAMENREKGEATQRCQHVNYWIKDPHFLEVTYIYIYT